MIIKKLVFQLLCIVLARNIEEVFFKNWALTLFSLYRWLTPYKNKKFEWEFLSQMPIEGPKNKPINGSDYMGLSIFVKTQQ